MKECVVYHWWSDPHDESPVKNLRTPLMLGIATLRACNPDIPIYVIDGSATAKDFGNLAEMLNFKIVPSRCSLDSYEVPGWRNLSRLFDIEKLSEVIEEDVIIYSDADVFWLQDPLPLHQDTSKFCFNIYNSGLFYYDKHKISPKFFEIFKAYAITALNDENFRYVSWQFSAPNPAYLVLDEAILCYMWHKHPYLFNKIDIKEHWMVGSVDPNNIETPTKMAHAHGLSVYNRFATADWKKNYARGILPLLIEECYLRLTSVLDPNEVYSEKEIDYYLPLQVKMSDQHFLRTLLDCKNEEGLFDFMIAIERFHKDN
jgi:hypothetical protein